MNILQVNRPLAVLGVLAALNLAMAGEAAGGHPDGEGGRLNVHVFDDFGGFDHILAPHAGISRLQILFAVHDRLYEPSSRTGRPVPRLALNASARNDFKTWRFDKLFKIKRS